MQITVRGVTYQSVAHAAQALGVSKDTVRSARSRGRLDGLGLGAGNNRRKDTTWKTSKPIVVCGYRFKSHADLCRAIGVGPSYVTTVVRRNTRSGWDRLRARVIVSMRLSKRLP